MKAAILLIDLLEDYFQDGHLKANRSTLVSHINALTSVGRASHLPIIWVRQAFKADLSDAFVWMRKTQAAVTIENTPGSQLLNELERDPTDLEGVLALDCTDSYDEEHHYVSVRYLTRGICTGKTNPDLFDLLTSHPSLFLGDSGGLEAHDTQARSVG